MAMENSKSNTASATNLISADNWYSERNSQWPGIASSFKVKQILVDTQTKYQNLMVFESTNHGKILTLDGVVQLTDAHEFTYHEMLVHTALFAHTNPKSVLVIGGGDGGIIREVCKHRSVENIVWCEIDEQVIEYSLKYFPQIATVANTDSRVNLHVGDGVAYLNGCKTCSFDIIIVDSSDPVGPAKQLFESPFYRECHRVLTPGGIMCSQAECMFEPTFYELMRNLITSDTDGEQNFKNGCVRYASIYVPMYNHGQIGCLLSQKADPNSNAVLDVTRGREIPEHISKTLKYYSAKIHSAAFVLPAFATAQFKTLISK